ncbi:MAG: Hsp20/alpha crystallin family protein [Pirellulaceae bacterium]
MMSRSVTRREDRGRVAHLYDDPFQTLEGRMNQMLRGMFDSIGSESGLGNYPVDVEEDDDKIMIEAEMPGFKRDEIEVNVENGVLTIKAERTAKEDSNDKKRHLTERRFTRVQRAFSLPRTVDGSDVDASLADGILTLTLKKTEESKPRKIEIRGGNS